MRKELLIGALTSIFASDAILANDSISDINPTDVASALVKVETTAYKADYEDITFTDLLPVENLNDKTATAFEYYYVTKAGKAQLANGDGSIAWVDSYLAMKHVKLHDGNTGYKYTLKDLLRASKMNISLDSTKASTAVEASLALAEEIAYNGDDSREIKGFWNYDGFTQVTALDNEAGSSKKWADKTAMEMLEDINHLFGTAYEQTKQKEFKPENKNNRLVLSVKNWNKLNKPLSKTDLKYTIRQYLVDNCPYISSSSQIVPNSSCPDSKIRIYQKDKKKISFYWGHTIDFKAPQHVNLEVRVPADFSIGGLVVRKPLSCWDMVGIE